MDGAVGLSRGWEAARDAAAATRFADLHAVTETESTNADVLALARAGAPEGVVVVADHQRAGGGRRDRQWHAPPGSSLLVSVLTRPSRSGLAEDRLHLVPTALGVAAAEVARDVSGADVALKWPNDLVAHGRKLAGILAESVVERGRVEALVVGIGVNVHWPGDQGEPGIPAVAGAPGGEAARRDRRDQTDGPAGNDDGAEVAGGDVEGGDAAGGDADADGGPPDLAVTAVGLDHLAGRRLDRAELLGALLVAFDRWYGALGTDEGRGALRARYRVLSATLARRVRVETPDGPVVGDAVDVDDEGHLLVVDECPDRPRALAVGDVIHLRRA